MAQPMTFPALPGWTEYEDAVQEYDALLVERRAHDRHLDGLERGEQNARDADDRAQATALREGAKDPGRPATKRWKAAVEAARDHSRVLDAAIIQQGAAVRALLVGNAEHALAVAQAATEMARHAYGDRLDGLLDARDTFWRARAVVAYLEGGAKGRYKGAGAPASLQDDEQAVSMYADRPEPVNARRALEGFRREVAPPPEPSEVAGYRMRRERDVRASARGGVIDSQQGVFVPVDAQGREVRTQ